MAERSFKVSGCVSMPPLNPGIHRKLTLFIRVAVSIAAHTQLKTSDPEGEFLAAVCC